MYSKNIFVKGHYRNGKYIDRHYRNYTKYDNPPSSNSISINKQILEIEYEFLKNITKNITPFKKNIKFQDIDNKIKETITLHLNNLVKVKKDNRIHSEYIKYLKDYIEDYLEDDLIKINNITAFYKSFEEITAIVYMIVLEEYAPDRFTLEYIDRDKSSNCITREIATDVINKIIDKNFQQLIYDFNKSDWDHRRQRFFEKEVQPKLYNPKIAFHMLFKNICNKKLQDNIAKVSDE